MDEWTEYNKPKPIVEVWKLVVAILDNTAHIAEDEVQRRDAVCRL